MILSISKKAHISQDMRLQILKNVFRKVASPDQELGYFFVCFKACTEMTTAIVETV